MRISITTLAIGFAVFWAGPREAAGQTAGMIGFQGVLKDVNGDLINGQVDLEFRLYSAEVGGTLLDMNGDGLVQNVIGQDAKHIAASAVTGVVSTAFGPVSPTAFTNASALWLQVSSNGTPLTPRKLVSPTPYSIGTRGIQVNDQGFVGIGTSSPGWPLQVIPDATGRVARMGSSINGSSALTFQVSPTTNSSRIQAIAHEGSAWGDLILNPQGGHVGIGTTPDGDATLHLQASGVLLKLHETQYGTQWWLRQNHEGKEFVVGVGNPLLEGNIMLRVGNGGTTVVKALQIVGGADIAEPFSVGDSADTCSAIEPGMVVVIDSENAGKLRLANEPYDRKVAGIISGANGLSPGMVMKSEGQPHTDGDHPVALTGRVWCWCDALYGPIEPGDRLTTSLTHGHAMKVSDRDRADGAVIGKAMTALSEGCGLVLVLVQPQ